MGNLMQKLKSGLAALLLTAFTAMPVYAEDVEIYTADNLGAAGVQPNILLILDTSGSMGTLEEVDEEYSGSLDYHLRDEACFPRDTFYIMTAAEFEAVDCGWSNKGYGISQNNCLAAGNAFAAEFGGYYVDYFTQYKGGWNEPTYQDSTGFVECATDHGIHGDGGVDKYVSNDGITAYTSDTAAANNWALIDHVENKVMYSSNYMNWKVSAAASAGIWKSRIDIMKNVIKNLAFGIDGVNLGIMRFNDNNHGGTVKYPVLDIAETRADGFATMDTWVAGGATPLSESLFEAYNYYAGEPVFFGDVVEGSTVFQDGGTKRYLSPVDDVAGECQKQFIIMLSDGAPTRDDEANSEIVGLDGFVGSSGGGVCDGWGDGKCLDDLAGYMDKVGFTATKPKTTVPDVHVATYTIGFAEDIPLLGKTASEGGGTYYKAYDSGSLLKALIELIQEIKGVDTTFSSPAVSVNAFNRTRHNDEMYFTLFRPGAKAHWAGNLKKYKLTFDAFGNPFIADSLGNDAVSNITGFFKDTAVSFWTSGADAPDGKDTAKGGAASQLTDVRNIYTYLGANSTLSSSVNHVVDSNSSLTKALLGIELQSDDYRTDVINWARGLDGIGNARREMGDPLHGQPALIQYGGTVDGDGNVISIDSVAFVPTNDGYLHAFDTSTGAEIFAFIPPELLPNLSPLYENSSGNPKIYGLDGSVTALIKDVNNNGQIETNEDKVYIYFGMRRGGNNYYGMDVTDRNNPVLMWTIKGGVDGSGNPIDTSLGDYSKLGQTWSTPAVRKIKYQGVERDVLIFGGGYDLDQDDHVTRTEDDEGNGIYIADALTGQLLFKVGPDAGLSTLQLEDMDYSIPADLLVADTTGDGYANLIYAGDMGGQVWRVDINNSLGADPSASISSLFSGGRIADLADDTIETNRRFYYPPDAALLEDDEKGGALYVSILISSGNRAHPMNTDVQDRIFMLRDSPIVGKPSTYVTITENDTTHDLFNTTNNIVADGSDAEKETASTALSTSKGWYIDLNKRTGEKALAAPAIYNGIGILTTYEPYDISTAGTACVLPQGTGFLYYVNLVDGAPGLIENGIVSHDTGDTYNTCEGDARCSKLDRSGIASSPTIIMNEKDVVCISTECDELQAGGKSKEVYWFEQ